MLSTCMALGSGVSSGMSTPPPLAPPAVLPTRHGPLHVRLSPVVSGLRSSPLELFPHRLDAHQSGEHDDALGGAVERMAGREHQPIVRHAPDDPDAVGHHDL